jgi:shikimate dehydrogenase
MIKAAVLGSPISHSLSPALHRKAYQELGLQASYEAIDLPLESADRFFASPELLEWSGLSLTMPLKESIFSYGFEIDEDALRIRSANTLVRRDNSFFATSTDLSAFKRLLAPLGVQRVAILGGGGTARAALGALDIPGTSLTFLLRTPSRSELLKEATQFADLDFVDMEHSLDGFDLVISTLPKNAAQSVAQMVSTSRELPALFEVLYDPAPTPALDIARARGAKTFDGMDLLVEQALDQIALFTRVDFEYDAMREILLKEGRSHLA